MGQKEKGILRLSEEETKKMKAALVATLEVYSKGDTNIKDEGLRILNGWGRIIFVISNDGKRMGLELTERWERERQTDTKERTIHPNNLKDM